jgi:hypothetical protein
MQHQEPPWQPVRKVTAGTSGLEEKVTDSIDSKRSKQIRSCVAYPTQLVDVLLDPHRATRQTSARDRGSDRSPTAPRFWFGQDGRPRAAWTTHAAYLFSYLRRPTRRPRSQIGVALPKSILSRSIKFADDKLATGQSPPLITRKSGGPRCLLRRQLHSFFLVVTTSRAVSIVAEFTCGGDHGLTIGGRSSDHLFLAVRIYREMFTVD